MGYGGRGYRRSSIGVGVGVGVCARCAFCYSVIMKVFEHGKSVKSAGGPLSSAAS